MFCNGKGTVHSSFSSANLSLQGIRFDETLELEISGLEGSIVLRDDTKNSCVGVQARMRIAAPRVTFPGGSDFHARSGISVTPLSLRK